MEHGDARAEGAFFQDATPRFGVEPHPGIEAADVVVAPDVQYEVGAPAASVCSSRSIRQIGLVDAVAADAEVADGLTEMRGEVPPARSRRR